VKVINIRLHAFFAESCIPKIAVTMERQTVFIPSSIYYVTSEYLLSDFRKRCLKRSPKRISLRYACFLLSTTGLDLASSFKGKNSRLSEQYFYKIPLIWNMDHVCRNSKHLPEYPSSSYCTKSRNADKNKYILYVTLELCKYVSGEHYINIIFRYIKINGSKHIIKYERQWSGTRRGPGS
jgi:hypothetical protein